MEKQKIRNIAIIAHVDHGKTTLVDALLKQSHVFRANQEEMNQEQILDSNALEREKGITILAKNVAIEYRGYKINIIDTPGHADFSGEVERTLGMADGALLVIDAQEGPMPQTRFVLKKALELGLKIIVVINKIDKPFARIPRTIRKTNDLFLELAKTADHLEFPILYAVAKEGKVYHSLPNDLSLPANVIPLFNTIIKTIPAPKNNLNGPFKMVVCSLDYNPHLGRIVLGKIYQGKISNNQSVIITQKPGKTYKAEAVYLSQGLEKQEVNEAFAGDIVSLAGISDATIGQTISDVSDTSSLPSIFISKPTLKIELGPNTSPFSGKEGKFSTSRQLEERLNKELETNLSLKIKKSANGRFQIAGKGELHLSVLLETMRREGYEMEVGKPEVIYKNQGDQISEPVEEVSLIVLLDYVGFITQEMGKRPGQLISMEPISDKEMGFIYHMPTRAILGLRSYLLNGTRGTVIFNSQFLEYQPLGKEMLKTRKGVLVAFETGTAVTFGLEAAQGRGITFIAPGTPVYEGMIIGLNSRENDMEINVCKGKHLTNVRSETADIAIILAPPVIFSLEQSLTFIEDDELLEITPKSLRLRKKFLTEVQRRRQKRLTEGKKFDY